MRVSAWYVMPTPADARRAAVRADLAGALESARCVLCVLQARLCDPADRALVTATLNEVRRAVEAARVLR